MVGQLMLLTTPLLGAIADHYGSPALMNVLGLSGIIGLVFLVISVELGIDWMLFPTFIGMGLMAMSSSIMTVKTSLEFEGPWVSRCVYRTMLKTFWCFGSATKDPSYNLSKRSISALNTLYDAGSITYLALWAIKKKYDLSMTVIAISYLSIAIVTFGCAMYCWRIFTSMKDDQFTPISSTPDFEEISTSIKESGSDDKEADRNIPRSLENDTEESRDRNHSYILISCRASCQQLQSSLFILLTIFFTFYLGKNSFVITTARDFLAHLGDDEKDNLYLTIYTMLMPASILAIPFVDIILNKYGFHGGLQTINVLAIAHGLIQVSSNSLQVQVIGFVIFSILRCFIFAITFNVLASFIAPDNTGKAAGVINMVAVIGILWNIPLTNLAILKYGSFFVPNLIYTVGPVLFIFVAWYMKKLIERNDLSRNASEEGV